MTEYVFRPSRRVNGKRVFARLFSGAYSLGRGEKPRRVALHTPDRRVAQKRLREMIVKAQQIAEGILPVPHYSQNLSLFGLVAEYEADMKSRGLAVAHVKESVARVRRIVEQAKWEIVRDVTPVSYCAWRAKLTCAAKTKKEYQTSILAFLNWLVRMDRLEVNPLSKVDKIDVRGKQVRPPRAFTEEELRALFEVDSPFRNAYLWLLYTGQRKSAVGALIGADITSERAGWIARFDARYAKDRKTRFVPLHPVLQDMAARAVRAGASANVVKIPEPEQFYADLRKAGIERKNAAGRSLYLHSFRKTFQTLGVMHGVNQRSAQELLGHSDANITAKVYTDVPSLALGREVAKLPDLTSAVRHAPKNKFVEMVGQLMALARTLVSEGETNLGFEALAARHGFEP